jgi:ligand-binding SRPBCC domain-containing protein
MAFAAYCASGSARSKSAGFWNIAITSKARQFRDVQISGPFKRWQHTHSFLPDGDCASFLEDRIEYELPLGAIGAFFGHWFVQRKLQRLFEYRHRITKEAMLARSAARGE